MEFVFIKILNEKPRFKIMYTISFQEDKTMLNKKKIYIFSKMNISGW
jgi:hypothetical protein